MGRRAPLVAGTRVSLKPRVTQFYQGLTSGGGSHDFEYGGKLDLLLNASLGKLGLWNGLSLTAHAEYNFGESANGRGGTSLPVNTALTRWFHLAADFQTTDPALSQNTTAVFAGLRAVIRF